MARQGITLHPGFVYMKRNHQQLPYKASKIKVLVADGHMLYGEALKHLLEIGDALHVVGVAGDCQETMDKYLTLRPQVLVVDAIRAVHRGEMLLSSTDVQAPACGGEAQGKRGKTPGLGTGGGGRGEPADDYGRPGYDSPLDKKLPLPGNGSRGKASREL